MNDQAIALLEKLAAKLGTTSQYLWGVMIKQATVSGITDLFQYCLVGIACYFYYKWLKSDKRDFDSGGDSWPAAVVCGVILGFLVIAVFFCFPNTVAAFVNPEYWALDRVLSAIKSK